MGLLAGCSPEPPPVDQTQTHASGNHDRDMRAAVTIRPEVPASLLFVDGDFDGDGTDDSAFFRNTGPETPLVVRLSNNDRAEHLIKSLSRPQLSNYGISRQPPGEHLTWCGKQRQARRNRNDISPAVDCSDPDTIEVTTDALLLTRFETSAELFYWTGAGFVSVFLSD